MHYKAPTRRPVVKFVQIDPGDDLQVEFSSYRETSSSSESAIGKSAADGFILFYIAIPGM